MVDSGTRALAQIYLVQKPTKIRQKIMEIHEKGGPTGPWHLEGKLGRPGNSL